MVSLPYPVERGTLSGLLTLYPNKSESDQSANQLVTSTSPSLGYPDETCDLIVLGQQVDQAAFILIQPTNSSPTLI